MEDKIKILNMIIKIIDIFSYISAFYELMIKHNIGIGIILTIISFVLTIIIYIMNNIEKLKDTYYSTLDEIDVPLFFKISIFVYILLWIVVAIAWLSTIGGPLTTLFLGFIFYNMPIIFLMYTKILCYIFQEDDKTNIHVSLMVSAILNIFFFIFALFDMRNDSIFYLILEIIFQVVPFGIAVEISE